MRISIERDLTYEQVIASYFLLQLEVLLRVNLVDGGTDDPNSGSTMLNAACKCSGIYAGG